MRQRWVERAARLAQPVCAAAGEGCLHASLLPEHRADCAADRLASSHLEALARLLLGLAPWLAATGGDASEQALRQELAAAARVAIVNGCTSEHADWFALDRGHQPIVDMAFLACALCNGRSALWTPLPEADKARILAGFRSLRDRKPGFNNWLLFAAAAEAFLKAAGTDWDPMRIDFALRQHEQWYLGDGHYGDGPHFHADWYNSFVIHPLLDLVLEQVAGCDDTWDRQRPVARERLRRYAAIQERSIAPDGSFPAIGRSLTYRCGAFHALAHAAWRDLLPDDLPPAQARCALDAVIARTLDQPGVWRDDGFLRIGLTGHQPGLGEGYITTGSLYLAAAAFLPLALPTEHAFWAGPDQPWTSVRLFDRSEDLAADHSLHES